jgi:hypothetical protein
LLLLLLQLASLLLLQAPTLINEAISHVSGSSQASGAPAGRVLPKLLQEVHELG